MKTASFLRKAAFAAALLAVPFSGWSAFDPVNDDTDIFLANPQFAATRPNVLLFVDNTANWSQSSGGTTKYAAVKAALSAVLTNIVTDSYNVGLGLFVETGSPNTNVDGAYIRYGIRQMTGTAADTSTNKGALISMINGLSENGDKGNGAVYSLASAEMFKYFAGLTSSAGHGKEKADAGGSLYFSSGRVSLAGSPLPAAALPNTSTASLYTSPIADGCQKNFIIIISNGEANDNSSAISSATTMFQTDTGSTHAQIALSPSGSEGIVSDEYARYMANGDCNTNIAGTQNVYTYTIDILPKSTGQGPAHTALLQSIASNGKGKYYAVTDITNTSQIETALTNIFQEVQAVNSVFASTTLPVSVNVRGTNLNQVYIGVFRPDQAKSPRWFGNLKLYKLGVNTSTNPATLFLADATGAEAENASTGFISGNARSFWTTDEAVDFWRYRDSSLNGAGGSSDAPDGDLVEKGGAAQQLRIAFATSQASRNVYTCTDGSNADGLCSAGALLSASPFNTSNISAADVGAYTTVSVASMAATADASPATTATVAVTTSTAHGLVAGNTVRIEGASPTVYNGDFTVLASPAPTSTTFSYRINSQPSSTRARATISGHHFNTGDLFVIDTSPNEYDAASPGVAVTKVDANTIEYSVSSPTTSHTGPVSSAKSRKAITSLTAPAGTGTTAQATVANHGYGSINSTVSNVTITGATEGAFNCGPLTITVTSLDAFTFTTCGTLAAASSNTALVTTQSAHVFSDGESIRIRDTSQSGYNGNSYSIVKQSSTTFSFTYTNPPVATGGVAGRVISSITYPFSGGSQNVALVTTATAHNFTATSPATVIRIAGTQGNWAGSNSCAGHNGTNFTVTEVVSTTSFKITGDRRCPTYDPSAGSGTAGAVAGFLIATTNGIVPVVSATGSPYAERSVTVSAVSPLSQASGTITAGNPSAGDTTLRDNIVNWVRGQDNKDNENSDCTGSPYYPCSSSTGVGTTPRLTDIRASIHGDVLHSRPAVVNYNRVPTSTDSDIRDSDIYVFYGSNDGMLRAVKGGVKTASSGPDANVTPGLERWSFVAKEFFGKLKRLRDQSPSISNTSQKDYFFDGSIGVYQKDAKGNGDASNPLTCDPTDTTNCAAATTSGVLGDNLHATKGDKVLLFLSMRRGGSFIYALDVTVPTTPKLLWRKSSSDTNWGELGQTWSEPKVSKLQASLGNANNPENVVLIMGAGYDDTVEDINPCLQEENTLSGIVQKAIGSGSITYTSSGSCTISGATGSATSYQRTKGRGIMVVDAFSGNVVFQAGAGVTTSSTGGAAGSARKLNVPDMTCAIPSDVTILDKNRDGYADRVYVGDTCGQVWRLDMTAGSMDDWVVTKIAAISSTTSTDIANKRKFLFPPDLVFGTDTVGNYTAVLLGTGDREHPFDANVVNRMYMFKDRDSADPGNPQAGATNSTSKRISGYTTPPTGSPHTDSDLFDATNSALVDASDTLGQNGWKITMAAGEKIVSSATTVAGSTFFNTNQPSASAGGGACGSNLGIAREYIVGYSDAGATVDLNSSGSITVSDRSVIHAGGGYLPSPVPVVVEIDGKKYQAVISGTSVQTPPGLTLEKRTRVYWYKEVE